MAHGQNHGPIGAVVSAWPALALVGSFELLMMLTRAAATPQPRQEPERTALVHEQLSRTEVEHTPESALLAAYLASLDGPGKPLSQRFLAERYGMDRRKVKQIISTLAQPQPV